MSVNVDTEFERWINYVDEETKEELLQMTEDEKAEAFGDCLKFGTGGLRGFLRAGSNGMNIYTVAQATQALANYLKKNFKDPSVAIARDSRNKGYDFVKVCVGVLAANGVVAYYSEGTESTPGLSFSVRHLHCSAGICITASHNPAVYNGYKAYGPDGCQITSKAADDISREMSKIDVFDDVNLLNFEDAKDSDYASLITDDVRDAFIEAASDCSVVPTAEENEDLHNSAIQNAADLKLVYTALHGTGYVEVVPVLEKNGFSNLVIVDEQAEPNGNFPTCPYPNPEMNDTLTLGIDYCKNNDADLLIATDPDADRVGVVVKHNGEYIRLNGNEVGILIFNYLCESLAANNEDLSNKVMVTTIVSSDIVDAIAKHYGVETRRTLTGFKYIGEQILHLEQDGEKERFMFGFEESCGYLTGTHVRDKDGISSSLIIAQMAAMYKSQGKDLVEVLNSFYEDYGYYKNDQVSVEYPGLEGQAKMKEVLSNLRNNPPQEYAGLKVVSSKDYNEDTKMAVTSNNENAPDEFLPKSNVLEFSLDGGSKIIVRPSGTEPKIKVYCFAYDNNFDSCMSLMEKLKSCAKELLA